MAEAAPAKKKNMLYIGLAIVLAIVCMNACSTYNNLVDESEKVDEGWANVQNQYQRRLDLIPNLVETVKGYATHESKTLENVTAMRTNQPDPAAQTAELEGALNKAKELEGTDMSSEENFQKYNQAQAELQRATSIYINAVHEAYPDLKANENFKDLQAQLEGTENRIATARKDYTQTVKSYNINVRRFPASIWAGIFGFDKKPQFAADEEAQHAQKVRFN